MKTYELTGPALDWAVAKCEGMIPPDFVFHPWSSDYTFRPSNDWAQCGPIIEREGISITETDVGSGEWEASIWINPDKHMPLIKVGPTPLIAAMRCYVASKLGDDVNVPSELEAA